MNAFQIIAAAFGRICLSLVFILSGINQILDWQGAKLALYNALCDLMMFTQGSEYMQKALESAIPWVAFILMAGVAVELIGGLLIFFGLNVRLGAFLLMVLLIPATVLFSHFWYLEGTERDVQLMMSLKNLSIFGGLLILLAFGKGKTKTSKPPEKKTEKHA